MRNSRRLLQFAVVEQNAGDDDGFVIEECGDRDLGFGGVSLLPIFFSFFFFWLILWRKTETFKDKLRNEMV